MRAFGKIILGLGLATTLAAAAPAYAGGGAVPAPRKLLIPMHAADHVAVTKDTRNGMADMIEGIGAWKAHGSDTPEMRIVAMTQGTLLQTKHAATEVDIHQIGGHGAEFDFKGKAQSTKFKVLIPVSAHYGLPYKQYAVSNEYQVTVHDEAGKQIYSKTIKSVAFGKQESQLTREDYITEHEIDLPFNSGTKFKVSFWPTATSKGGFNAGREVTISLAK